MSILQMAIGAILDNYADVVEGGNSYRGSGTEWAGVCGTQSPHELEDTTITSDASTNTTTVTANDLDATNAARLVATDGPPFFLLCTSQAALTGNTGAARKISAYASGSYTVAKAFADSVASGDVFKVRHGFKRMPDRADIESDEEGTPGGYDRYFHLRMLPGARMPWYGGGREMYDSTLEVRLRILKRGRERFAVDSALENILYLRSVITRADVRDGTYAHLVDAEGVAPEIETNDQTKVVVVDKLRCIYRVNASYL